MKKILCALIVLFMGISTFVFAKTENVINERNEYGGKTVASTYSPGNKEYKDGISNSIAYFDNNGKMVKSELFFFDESIPKDGLFRSIAYFDNNGKMVKSEVFFTEESARKNGLFRSIANIENGKVVKTFCYNSNGKEIRCP